MSSDEILKYLMWLAGVIGLLFAGFFLGGYKKKKSDNTKGDYDNRVEMASDWLERLEKTTNFAGNAIQDKEKYRSQILTVLHKAESHFEICENPQDDFKAYIDFLIKEHE